jgi:transmembrane sensor
MNTQNHKMSGYDPSWSAEEQAQWWVVQMDLYGDDVELHARFEDWIAQDIAHSVAYHQNDSLWEDMAFAITPSPTPTVQLNDQQKYDGRMPVARASKRTGRWIGAGVFACMVVLTLWLMPQLRLFGADYANMSNEVERLVLEDKTVVFLDSQSAIDVRYHPDRREINLLSGRAFFEVTPNKTRPFIVHAAETQARALGTAYGVRLEGEVVQVKVREGLVGVSREQGDELVRLQAGQGVRLGGQNDHVEKTILPQTDFGWLTGQLTAENLRVPDLLTALERYVPGRVVLIGQAVREKTLSGRFDTKNAAQAIDDVALLLNLDVVRVTPYLTILK